MINNTFARNVGWENVGVLSGQLSEVRNNIVALGSGGIMPSTGLTPIIESNCFFGNSTNHTVGDMAILDDPRFLDDQATFYLSGSSPCIDAGLNSVVQPDWTDVYGRPRVSGGTVDIGAVEMQPDDIVLPVTHVPSFTVEVVGGITYLTYQRTVDGDYTGELLPVPHIEGNVVQWDFQVSLDINSVGSGSSYAGTIPLGVLAPGSYQLQPFSWGVPLAITEFTVPADVGGTMIDPTLTIDGFQFSIEGVDHVRYFTDLTSDFNTWDTVATTEAVGAPVFIPANLLSGRDFFRVRMEPLEVLEP